ncbi:MAG: LysR family transcriptional regulator [Erysipelotrichaceae bacterium]
MNIEQYHYFKTIVEEKSYTAAAYVLNISQSALSKQIIKMEEELGVKLFSRDKRQISLTPFGQTVYQDCLKVIKENDKLLSDIKQLKNTVKIASFPFFYQYGYDEKLNIIKEKYPELNIMLEEIEEYEIDAADYDLLLIREEYDNCEYEKYTVDEDSYVILHNSKRNYDKNINLSNLKDEQFFCMSKYTRIADTVSKICRENDITKLKNGKMHTNISKVKNDEGIIICPLKTLKGFDISLCRIKKLNKKYLSHINAYIRKDSPNYGCLRELVSIL